MKLNGIKADVLALSLLTAGEMAHAFSAMEPSRFTIANWVLTGEPSQVDKNIANLRSGYIPALAFGVGLAGVVSWIAKSKLPLLFGTVAGLAMLALYEQALPAEKRLGPLKYLGHAANPILLDGLMGMAL